MPTRKEIAQLRTAEQLRMIMTNILMREEAGLYGLATAAIISRVEVSNSQEHVKFYVSILGDADLKSQILDTFKRQLKAIRYLIGQRLHSRKVPEIRFMLDESIEKAQQLTRTLDALRQNMPTTESSSSEVDS